jgi:uncharacterized protein (DUF1684 family)
MKKASFVLLSLIIAHLSFAQTTIITDSVNKWHKKRLDYLTRQDGWLNLEGLFWLHKGTNTFGSAAGTDCHYTNNLFPENLGSFIYEGDSVVWKNASNHFITINKKATLHDQGYTVLSAGANYSNQVMDYGQFSWVIIKREDKVGVRFRNLKANTLLTFKGIDRFPINEHWKLKAKIVQPAQDFLMITNVLGQTTASKNAGTLHFQKDGIEYTLDVIDEGGPTLFIVFADQTSGKSTYGSGRFIDIPKPDKDGNTEIDFNIAYNPPCAFTAFATCPLPPKQNRLQLAIEAGEKNYGHH